MLLAQACLRACCPLLLAARAAVALPLLRQLSCRHTWLHPVHAQWVPCPAVAAPLQWREPA